MESLLGFKLDFWDYATFHAIATCVILGVVFLMWMAGLPGRIAIARKHPEAEVVMLMESSGFLVVVPWIQAFISSPSSFPALDGCAKISKTP